MTIKNTVSIILPVHNEATHLEVSVKEIRKFALISSLDVEILLIDDGSSDSSWAACENLIKCNIAQKALKLSRNFGKESAVRAGLEACTGDCVIVMDSDLQHPPELISEMITHWQNGRQIVEAIKVDRSHDSALKRFLSARFYKMYRLLTDVDLEGASDFKLLDRCVVDHLIKMQEINQFLRGTTKWMGFDSVAIPFTVQERAGDETSWTNAQLFSYGIGSILSFSQKPLYIFSILTTIFLILFSLVVITRALLIWSMGSPPDGTTTILVSLSIFAALISANQTIGNIYLGRVFEQAKLRPVYIVSHSINSETYQ